MSDNLNYELLNQFAEVYSSKEDPLLAAVNDFTQKNHAEPHMLSGHVQGLLLKMFSLMIRPQRILEIGTFTGYSALCLAEGLTEDGCLHTIESREQYGRRLHKTFLINRQLAIKLNYIQVSQQTSFLNSMKPGTWCLLMPIKRGYINYFELVLPKVRKNGFIFADNIFFHGEALKENAKGKSGKAVKEFNNYINNRTDIEKVVLTVRDGLYLIRKR